MQPLLMICIPDWAIRCNSKALNLVLKNPIVVKITHVKKLFPPADISPVESHGEEDNEQKTKWDETKNNQVWKKLKYGNN